jgi:SAM-dependent methyltransferase
MSDPAASIISLYDRHATAWDRKRGRTLFEKPWMDRFLAMVRPHTEVVELGCGAGQPMSRYLVDCGMNLTGVDSSPAMIALCRERFPAHEWHVADMRGLDLARRFDGILAWDSFFHLKPDDQRAMFAVFADHAADGAALMFTSGPDAGIAMGTFEGEPLYHASLAPEEYRRLLHIHGFEVAAHVPDDKTCCGHTVWLARRVARA